MINILNYFSSLAIPLTIIVIIFYGLKEKKKTFDVFLVGAKEGIEIVLKMLPTLIGIFLAIGLLRSSGIIDFIVNLLTPITNFIKVPSEIMPLALLRPISGSASMAVAVDIMNNYGVDTLIGAISSIIPVNIIMKLPIKIEFILILCSPNNIYPNRNPKKIPTPPSIGVAFL